MCALIFFHLRSYVRAGDSESTCQPKKGSADIATYGACTLSRASSDHHRDKLRSSFGNRSHSAERRLEWQGTIRTLLQMGLLPATRGSELPLTRVDVAYLPTDIPGVF